MAGEVYFAHKTFEDFNIGLGEVIDNFPFVGLALEEAANTADSQQVHFVSAVTGAKEFRKGVVVSTWTVHAEEPRMGSDPKYYCKAFAEAGTFSVVFPNANVGMGWKFASDSPVESKVLFEVLWRATDPNEQIILQMKLEHDRWKVYDDLVIRETYLTNFTSWDVQDSRPPGLINLSF